MLSVVERMTVARLGGARAVVAGSWRRLQSSAAGSSRFSLQKVGDVALVTMDDHESKVNTISTKMQAEFAEMLTTIENDAGIKSAVLISGKPDNFIAGADIRELDVMKTAQDAENASKMGQQMCDRIENCKKPIVAAINGSCLGGGLEVAMATNYRIATTNKKTQLGLPEVKLGLLPGAGGTQRLPRLVGIQAALPAMLTGSMIRPDKAKRMGLVDEVVDPFALRHAALSAAQELADGTLKPKRKKKNILGRLLEDNPLGRRILFDQATKEAMEQSGGNYPAISKILQVVRVGADNGMKAGLEAESKAFGELTQTEVSACLRGVFFGEQALKQNKYGKPSEPIKTVGVLGAGLMGAGIAQVSAQKNFDPVLLKDVNDKGLSRGLQQIEGELEKRVKKRRMTQHEKDATMSRIVGLTNTGKWEAHFKKCDLVVEAVLEEIGLKHKVFQQMESIVSESAVLATNTSAIPIRDIAKGVKKPERVIGMHWFSPVPQMPLLEIIPHEGTNKDTISQAVDFGNKQGKTVVVCKDVPGFYVNKCLGPYLSQAIALVQEGVSFEQLDNAMKKYGMPVGPVTLCDEVGLDVAMHVQETLAPSLGVRMTAGDSNLLKELVDNGILGRKNGKGFYLYPAKPKKGANKELNLAVNNVIAKFKRESPKGGTISEDEIQQRMAFSFINEALFCLQEEVVESPVAADIGAIFGTGFAPFRGGPIRVVDNMGAQNFVDTMNLFADKYGQHFVPAPIVVDYAKNGKKFHSS